MEETLGRATIGTLADEESFLKFAQHVKALYLRRADRERQHDLLDKTLVKQIRVFTEQCLLLTKRNPRCAVMWREVQKELQEFPPLPPLPGAEPPSSG